MTSIALPPLHDVIKAVEQAGRMLADEFHRLDGPRGAHDHADVDEEIARYLRDALIDLFPARWVCEETPADDEYWPAQAEQPVRTFQWNGETVFSVDLEFNDRAHRARRIAFEQNRDFCWLVDPHDGTSAFLEGFRGTAVSVALLRVGVPVLGVVHAPLPPDRGSDTIAWSEGMPGVLRDGSILPPSLPEADLTQDAAVFVSQAAPTRPWQNAEAVAPARFIGMPSIAYRLARVACGDGVAGVSLAGPCGWDYAGGHALLIGAGGVLLDERGEPVRYTPAGDSNVQFCFGGSPAAARALAEFNWRRIRHGASLAVPPQPRPPRRIDAIAHDRALGCMLGLCAGDALGGLVEFQGPHAIRHDYPDGVRELVDGGTWDTLAGQPTDDGELALSLARALAECGAWDAERVATSYAAWLRSDPFDCGLTIGAALRAAAAASTGKAAAARAAANPGSQANGALMRVAPIGLWAMDAQEAAEAAREDASLTHPHAVPVAASAAFAAAIATAVGGGERDAMQAAAEKAAGSQPDILRVLRAAYAGTGVDDATQNEGWVLHALQNAFHRLWHAADLETALVETVGMGGDTDTNAAICGALLGAAQGVDAVPWRWRRQVLSCRPLSKLGARRPRPPEYWPVDLPELIERLLQRRAAARTHQ